VRWRSWPWSACRPISASRAGSLACPILASDPGLIRAIKESVTIPVMAKARIGHFVEAQILQALKIDYIDESEVLTPADEDCHIDKTRFDIPFVCGARNLGEALRRVAEGAAMIRTKGEAGTGDVVKAVRHMRTMNREIRQLANMPTEEIMSFAKVNGIPYELALEVKKLGRLPVVNFAAGGIATPADAALMMQLGCDGVFVGSGIFKSADPARRASAIVKATAFYDDPGKLLEVSMDLGDPMPGLSVASMPDEDRLAGRGWGWRGAAGDAGRIRRAWRSGLAGRGTGASRSFAAGRRGRADRQARRRTEGFGGTDYPPRAPACRGC